MRKSILSTLLTALMVLEISAVSFGNNPSNENDNQLVNAKVVEVTDMRISVITSSGNEHVVAIDGNATKVTRYSKLTSIKDIREGDVITIELDSYNPMKFAKRVVVGSSSRDQLAKQ
jgi:hypothetical protein